MKLVFDSRKQAITFGALCGVPLGALITFLLTAILSSLTRWEIIIRFNMIGEAPFDILLLLIGIAFMIYIFNLVLNSETERVGT